MARIYDMTGQGTAPGRTTVTVQRLKERISGEDTVVSLGSCFSTEIGERMSGDGYRILNNPFGVLYNPVSIADSLRRLADAAPFTVHDVIPRDTNPVYGRQAERTVPGHRPITPEGGGFVSFHHHGSFARSTPETFLEYANACLYEASSEFSDAGWVIITFGTAWAYRHIERDIIVSNCHKHPATEFRREFLDTDSIVRLWKDILEAFPDKRFIFTVSPIRHKKDGMHGNQISKATLLLAVERLISGYANAFYFPAYEIVLDELRDYSWYAPDLVHPSAEAVDMVWQRFRSAALR